MLTQRFRRPLFVVAMQRHQFDNAAARESANFDGGASAL